jgi:prenylcysteine oxidase/farnesylcysteine lyase
VFNDESEPAELGASIFVEVNQNLVSAAKELGLTVDKADKSRLVEAPEKLGVWDGQDFVFTQPDGGYYWWDLARLLWKYGWTPIRTHNLMKSTVGKFLKMYEEPHFPFRSLSQAAYDLGLTDITSLTGEQFLEANNIRPPFSKDIIQASTRVNYAQNLPFIHGLETMVCMATDGAMFVKGGNWQIFDGMIKAASATVKLNTTVQKIRKTDLGTYVLSSKGEAPSSSSSSSSSSSTTVQEREYDVVVLAAPFQDASITLTPSPPHIPDKIPYVKLHVTLLTSPHRLSPTAFNLSSDALVPSVVLTTLGPDETPREREEGVGRAGFFSISTLRRVVNPSSHRDEYLYKIFSPAPVTKTDLARLLGCSRLEGDDDAVDDDVTWIHRHVWHSYPYLYPRVTFDDPVLDEGLWYTSGIESFISTMETSSLMGMNVARLVVDDWEKEGEREGEKLVKAKL